MLPPLLSIVSCFLVHRLPYRIPNKLVPRILLSNVLFVFAVYASKEWLLNFDVGVFWVLMRVLACGGLGVLVWEVSTAQAVKRGAIEVRIVGFYAGCFWDIY
jgi:zinc transporter 5/7